MAPHLLEGNVERPRVLLVENDAELRVLLAGYLAEEGFRVAQARNGDEAMELFVLGLRPSAIVLDLVMPTMSGWDLLASLERSTPLAGIPKLVITGCERHGLDVARTPVLLKPFDCFELLRWLRARCAS